LGGIEGAVEEVLERARHVAQVLGRAQQDSIGPQQIFHAGLQRPQAAGVNAFTGLGTRQYGLRHLLGITALRVEDDEQMLVGHECRCHRLRLMEYP